MYTDKNKYLNLLTKTLLHEATSEEEEQLLKWRDENSEHEAFIEEITKVWNLSGNYAENLPIDLGAAWEKFDKKLNQKPSKKIERSVIRTLLFSWKAAAVLVGIIAISAWWGIQESNTESILEIAEIRTGAKEQKEIILPDGSVVMLNENSLLSYAKEFEIRNVRLEGEAFFEVTKQAGKPFEIITTTTKTTVLGTSFNVRAYDNKNVEVAVLTGKVAVEELNEEKESVFLLPNERVVYNVKSKAMEKEVVLGANSVAWKTQELNFDNTQLREVIETLERYFEVEIEGDQKILNCYYTGGFKTPTLDEVFNTIAFTFPTNLEVKKVDEKYILIGQGCE